MEDGYPPIVLTEPKRLNAITSAITRGIPKNRFKFQTAEERVTWDRIAEDVAVIRAAGLAPDTVNE